MKTFLLLAFLTSTTAFATPVYTLNEICQTYGKVGNCGSVDFCEDIALEKGCHLAKDAPAHVEGICKLQTQKLGCQILQQQGNCVWLEKAISGCRAKFDSF